MKRLYWLLNKPWESVPVLLRAYRFQRQARRLEDEEHIAWAKNLVAQQKQESINEETRDRYRKLLLAYAEYRSGNPGSQRRP